MKKPLRIKPSTENDLNEFRQLYTIAAKSDMNPFIERENPSLSHFPAQAPTLIAHVPQTL
jgi:hypothetical protein